MTLWAHTLVKNEERYVWYAVMSVINHVDKILLWDTGSTDNTIEIGRYLKKTYPQKVDFRELGDVDINEFTEVRNEMLKETKADWFMIVDGDEVWWDKKVIDLVEIVKDKGNSIDTIVNRYTNIVGDIFHYQDSSAGRYTIDGRTGFLTVRLMNRNIPGLTIAKPHGQQGIYDGDGGLIQERDVKKRVWIDEDCYLHFTNVVRSASIQNDLKVVKRKIKLKYELGHPFPLTFFYPEVFFKPRPDFIYYPFTKMTLNFYAKSLIQTPLRHLKRSLYKGKSGY